MLQFFMIIIIVIIIAQISAYFWHRIGAHTDLVGSKIHETHKNHHEDTLDDKAHEDFYWAFIFLIGLYFLSAVLYQIKILNLSMSILLPSLFFFIFVLNWYIHQSYHTENHWLNNFEWFRQNKALHYQHHYNPKNNYDIVMPSIIDRIFGTYQYPTLENSLNSSAVIAKEITINYFNLQELMNNI